MKQNTTTAPNVNPDTGTPAPATEQAATRPECTRTRGREMRLVTTGPQARRKPAGEDNARRRGHMRKTVKAAPNAPKSAPKDAYEGLPDDIRAILEMFPHSRCLLKSSDIPKCDTLKKTGGYKSAAATNEQIQEINAASRILTTRKNPLYLYCLPLNFERIFGVSEHIAKQYAEAVGVPRESVFAFILALELPAGALYSDSALRLAIYSKIGALYDFDPDLFRAAVLSNGVLWRLADELYPSLERLKLSAIDDACDNLNAFFDLNLPDSLQE